MILQVAIVEIAAAESTAGLGAGGTSQILSAGVSLAASTPPSIAEGASEVAHRLETFCRVNEFKVPIPTKNGYGGLVSATVPSANAW